METFYRRDLFTLLLFMLLHSMARFTSLAAVHIGRPTIMDIGEMPTAAQARDNIWLITVFHAMILFRAARSTGGRLHGMQGIGVRLPGGPLYTLCI